MAKAARRGKPDAAKLEKMLKEHVAFEVKRLREAAALWGIPKYGKPADAMIRESCLIHLRLLLDFFYPRCKPEDSKFQDVFASDYLPESDKHPPELAGLLKSPAWLDDLRKRLDWRLAHLSMKRFDFEKSPFWEIERQLEHMDCLIGAFVAALPEKQQRWFGVDQSHPANTSL